MFYRVCLPAALMAIAATGMARQATAEEAPRALVLHSPERPALCDILADVLRNAGYTTNNITYDELCRAGTLDAARVRLLALPDGARLPAASAAVIESFLHGGGDLLALNTPLWRTPLVQSQQGWTDIDDYRQTPADSLMDRVLFPFAQAEDIETWQRSSSSGNHAAARAIESDPDARVPALHVTIDGIDGWDTFVSPRLEHPFPEGQPLTVFRAKGNDATPALALEWCEADGSRWIATVPLTNEWRTFALEPADFHFWESVEARRNTFFKPEDAVEFRVGLAHSHTPLPAGRHEYWLGAVGTAARAPRHEPLLVDFAPPALETLCPDYKFFPIGDAASLADHTGMFLPLPQARMRSPQPRPGAGGFDKGRAWRWEPLLQAKSAEGAWRGHPATLLVHADGDFKGGVWVSIGVEDPGWYETTAARAFLETLAWRLHDGVFLVDGGARFYTQFPEQPVTLGLRAVNLAQEARENLIGRVTLRSAHGETIRQQEWPGSLGPSEIQRLTVEAGALTPPEGACIARAEILRDGAVLDSAEHEVFLWQPSGAPKYVTVENGEMTLDGKRWRAHGVNYMPSSGIGTEDTPFFEYWLGAQAYDPVIVQRDLDHIRDMGLNAISIFIYHQSLPAQNLLDLLRRCTAMGIKVNLSLRPGTPFDFEWEKVRELITYFRLPEQDCVFALDLAWEPMFPEHTGRARWDPAWRAWVEERYGNLDNAERDWQYTAPRDAAGLLTNPGNEMLVDDGPWRSFVAAYRRFLDTLLYEKYSQARRLVREIDPHHLVSFRMTEAGDPTFRGTNVVPYDFACLAGAVDALEPEAYGRIGDWEWVKPALFEAAYAQWAAPNLPFFWAEAGTTVAGASSPVPLPDRLDFQAQLYHDLYRMLIESGSDGVFWWWYPGGYRVNERSDFGIINSDGTDRPVTRVIREHAAAFLDGPPAPRPDLSLTMDRDAHPAGVPGIYEALKDEYWHARAEGHTPGLRTEATGTTSANCPLVAVGNVPCTGNNPPKYLDAFFDLVEWEQSPEQWLPLDRDEIPASANVRLRFTITNLGEATLLAPA
ncbi:MAG: hypothetical protein HYZ00_08640, partial [Candidatus Hydrogenedentes bacterium]|nr:hypothetical protein [Candidatus Hydrogenedentota bacterium]